MLLSLMVYWLEGPAHATYFAMIALYFELIDIKRNGDGVKIKPKFGDKHLAECLAEIRPPTSRNRL